MWLLLYMMAHIDFHSWILLKKSFLPCSNTGHIMEVLFSIMKHNMAAHHIAYASILWLCSTKKPGMGILFPGVAWSASVQCTVYSCILPILISVNLVIQLIGKPWKFRMIFFADYLNLVPWTLYSSHVW